VYWRRRVLAAAAAALVIFLGWFAVSFGSALTNQSLGSAIPARAAEWFRGHGFASFVAWAENTWYSHHPPPVGGRPPKGAIKRVRTTPSSVNATVAHLPAPKPITPFASPPIPGEGQWSPAGRTVDGVPAIYTTTLRPDAVHTSYVVGVAWMDTRLLKATLYSGNEIPGGGPYTNTAPIPPQAATSLDAVFNAGFLMPDANGGYYTDGHTIIPLRQGAASFVVYANGSATVGAWGTQVTMTPQVVSVRQNLVPLVNNGKPVAGLNSSDTSQWGATVGNQVYVWRSALGVTADGALVYVGGPGLNITDLANILARAGAVRGMELDINQDWVNYASFQPSAPGGAATAANGTNLVANMTGGTSRYFQSWWQRDFITMSATSTPIPVASTSPGGTAASSSASARRRTAATDRTGRAAGTAAKR